jgi:hypothetical protein
MYDFTILHYSRLCQWTRKTAAARSTRKFHDSFSCVEHRSSGVQVCMYVCVYVCVHVRACVYMCVSVSVWMGGWVGARAYVSACLHCDLQFVNLSIHTHIHTQYVYPLSTFAAVTQQASAGPQARESPSHVFFSAPSWRNHAWDGSLWECTYKLWVL